jgi:hypothetical protein
MLDKYFVYQLDSVNKLPERLAEEGILRKNWYAHPELGECLFKEATPSRSVLSNGRMDWTEKVVWELATLLDIPAARCELAAGYFDGSDELTTGVLSINCIPVWAHPLSGREVLIRSSDYDPDRANQYTIERIITALDNNNVLPPNNVKAVDRLDTAAKLFVGFALHQRLPIASPWLKSLPSSSDYASLTVAIPKHWAISATNR